MGDRICFIITTIGDEGSLERASADEKYDFVYEPVLKELGFVPKRADKEGTPNSISRDIVSRVIDSDLVIADVTDSNPNVFYELAIRNAVKRPVIVVKHPKQRLPFDIYDKRAVQLDMRDNRQWNNAKKDLAEHIKNAEANKQGASESILSDFTFDIDKTKAREIEMDASIQLKDIKDSLSALRSEILTRQPTPSYPAVEPIHPRFPNLSLEIDKEEYTVGDSVKCRIRAHQIIKEDYSVVITINNDAGMEVLRLPYIIKKGFREAVIPLAQVDKSWAKGAWDVIIWASAGGEGIGKGIKII